MILWRRRKFVSRINIPFLKLKTISYFKGTIKHSAVVSYVSVFKDQMIKFTRQNLQSSIFTATVFLLSQHIKISQTEGNKIPSAGIRK